MASPRLSFGGPIILAFNWSNGMPRLCETCTAATNCPRFLNPCAACCRFVPGGRRLCSLLASLVLSSRWSETEDPLESFPELLCEFEFEFMLWPVPPPPPPPPCPCCAYSGIPSSATDNAMIKVLDFIFLPPFLLAPWRTQQLTNVDTEIERKTILRERHTSTVSQLRSHYLAGLKRQPRAHAIFASQVVTTGEERVLKNTVLAGRASSLSFLYQLAVNLLVAEWCDLVARPANRKVAHQL